jgi:hypothetical protein
LLSVASLADGSSEAAHQTGDRSGVTVADGRVSGAFDLVSIGDAIDTIAGQAGFDHAVRPGLADRTVSAVFDALPVDEALAEVLADYNYVLKTAPDGAIAVLWVTGLKADAPATPPDQLLRLLSRRAGATEPASHEHEPAVESAGPSGTFASLPSTASGPGPPIGSGPTGAENSDQASGPPPIFVPHVDERGPGGGGTVGAPTIDMLAHDVELNAALRPDVPLPEFEPVYSDTGPGDFYAAPPVMPVYDEVEERWEFPDE